MQPLPPIQQLNRSFAIEGAAQIIAGEGDLPKVHVSVPAAEADIYLHGAHITSWRPAGGEDVIFLSKRSHWEDGRAIRGGIPICFPWFRGKIGDSQAPAHGFVRTKAWQLDSITQDGDAVIVALSTESDEATQRWWPHEFRLEHRVTVEAELKLEFIVTNTGTDSFRFEEALHTYHRVGDAKEIRVSGLDRVAFLDNTDTNREKIQQGDVVITKPTDNAYLKTSSALILIDPVLQRRLQIAKEHSLTTVVWIPGKPEPKQWRT